MSNNNTKASIYEITIGNFLGRIKIDYENKNIIIKGLDYDKLISRIREIYNYNRVAKLFEAKYTAWSLMMWEREKIEINGLKVDYLQVPLFFSLELFNIFQDLKEFFHLSYYKKVCKEIWDNTWISNFQKRNNNKEVNLNNLNRIEYELKPYQEEFIENYNQNKYLFDLEGAILSFDQGLGKTLTSIALAECLDKEQVVIICPNSLKENWTYEIKSYFKKYRLDDKLWLNEVYAHGISKYEFHPTKTKYIIVNIESIPKIYNLVNKKKDTIIIVDESHNFRNSNGKRTKELLKLKEILNCKDNLLMSGTPIKESPDELVPALRMIDPYFTEELGERYSKTFHTNRVQVAGLVKTRFQRAIWRKTKEEVLNLPKKNIESVRLPIKHPNKYIIQNVEQKIHDRYNEIYKEKKIENDKLNAEFCKYVIEYSSASKKETQEYLDYISKTTNTEEVIDIHSHRKVIYSNFLNDYVYPNIIDEKEYKHFKEIKSKYINMIEVAIGTALGEILPPLRTQCYIDIYNENKLSIIRMIKNNNLKTIIFTPYIECAKYISDDLTKMKIGNELIIGETKNRMDHINNFKNEDVIDVLVATIQTLSTGVTLVEANQMFFFGLAWRNADNQQCQDRIYRIGQTNEVFIYNIFLLTSERNITDRIEDADTNSNEVFNAIINGKNYNLNEDTDALGNIYYPTGILPEESDLFDDYDEYSDDLDYLLDNEF